MSGLRAGAARACITPPLGTHLCGFFNDRLAEDVGDDLFAKALVLAKDDTTIAIVVCDLIAAYQPDFDRAKARAHELTGIPVENIFMSCTHTHYGPASVPIFVVPREDAYMEWAMDKAGDAVKLAYNRLRPAKVGHASGQCPEECHNRRWHMKDGTVRMNPGHQNPDALRPAGPTDPQLGLLVLRTPAGAPIAALGNLSLHYVGVREDHNVICADYFAAFGRSLNRCAGAQFVCPLANGTFGDVNNIDAANPPRVSRGITFEIERVGNVVAAEAWRIWSGLREDDFRDDVPLGARLAHVNFPARTPTAEELAAARAVYESGEKWDDAEWIYARELVLLADEPSEWPVPIHSLRLGDLGIVGLPGEVFTEIGLDIKARSPFTQTMNIGIANGTVGYVATDKALDEGSYETRLCRHVRAPKGTGKLWADTAVAGLEALR